MQIVRVLIIELSHIIVCKFVGGFNWRLVLDFYEVVLIHECYYVIQFIKYFKFKV